MDDLFERLIKEPALLEKFQRILVDDGPKEWLSLIDEEKNLYERYRERIAEY